MLTYYAAILQRVFMQCLKNIANFDHFDLL